MEKDDAEDRRLALLEFFRRHKTELKSVNQWAEASGVGESTIRGLLKGNRQKNMRADTYAKIAAGASKMLARPVSEAALLGADTPDRSISDLEHQYLAALRRLPSAYRRAELQALNARVLEIEKNLKQEDTQDS